MLTVRLLEFVNTMPKACVVACDGADESATRTEKLNVPALDAVPLNIPAELKLIPGGRFPVARDQEYGADPPLTDNVCW
jgi:hypothetical protein